MKASPDEGYVPAPMSRPPWRRPAKVEAREAEMERAQNDDERRIEVALGGVRIQPVRYD